MRIAVEGCAHGALDEIYETLLEIEKKQKFKIDLLLICGDFQATRSLSDLKCMSIPDKYKSMGSFYKYYSGEKEAPFLTVFIGGNHEASNYLQELPYGGWVANNIYYLGFAGVIKVGGLRIGGLSGIYKSTDYFKGHYEILPYTFQSLKSVYHVRNLETFRLKQLIHHSPEIMLSHDWPLGVTDHGDLKQLLRRKQYFKRDIENGVLGSRPAREILDLLKPSYWFSGHLHVKFPAIIPHEDSSTKFLALDKCLPGRQFLQILNIESSEQSEKESQSTERKELKLEYDVHWLAILKSTSHLLDVTSNLNYMPSSGYSGRSDYSPTLEELSSIRRIFKDDFEIQRVHFTSSVAYFDPLSESISDLFSVEMPKFPLPNSQTISFIQKLGIEDPINRILESMGQKYLSLPPTLSLRNEDEISLEESDEEEENREKEVFSQPKAHLILPPPSKELPSDERNLKINENEKEDEKTFIIDTKPNEFPRTGIKRRNKALYNHHDD